MKTDLAVSKIGSIFNFMYIFSRVENYNVIFIIFITLVKLKLYYLLLQFFELENNTDSQAIGLMMIAVKVSNGVIYNFKIC